MEKAQMPNIKELSKEIKSLKKELDELEQGAKRYRKTRGMEGKASTYESLAKTTKDILLEKLWDFFTRSDK